MQGNAGGNSDAFLFTVNGELVLWNEKDSIDVDGLFKGNTPRLRTERQDCIILPRTCFSPAQVEIYGCSIHSVLTKETELMLRRKLRQKFDFRDLPCICPVSQLMPKSATWVICEQYFGNRLYMILYNCYSVRLPVQNYMHADIHVPAALLMHFDDGNLNN